MEARLPIYRSRPRAALCAGTFSLRQHPGMAAERPLRENTGRPCRPSGRPRLRGAFPHGSGIPARAAPSDAGMHSTDHKVSNKIHNIYARIPGAFLPRARPSRSTLQDLPEAAALDGLHGRVGTGRFGRRDQLMQNARRTASGRPPMPSLLWPQPLKRICYRHLPVVGHPYYCIPHLVQTPKGGVFCGRSGLAPFCLYGVWLRGVGRRRIIWTAPFVPRRYSFHAPPPCEGPGVVCYDAYLFAAPAGKL